MTTLSVGSCEIIIGPMFSGKSSNLIAKLTQAADVGFKVAYCNHSSDVRQVAASDGIVTTHNSGFQKLSSKIMSFKTDDLSKLNWNQFDVIGIDEYQFFEGMNELVRNLVLNKGKRVIIASLDYDTQLNPFGEIHELFGLCGPGDINKLYAICKFCDKVKMSRAGWTLKIAGDSSAKIEIGGSDKYIPVCLNCHQLYNNI